MADVFISYHEESAGELAEQIADALEDAGISAWCARRDMALGGNFAREIPNQIHTCRLFLLILNDNVYHSEHIENEVGIAFSRVNKKENIRILPLELGGFTRKDWVEYYLIHTQGVKFPAQPDEKRLQRLVKQIVMALNREAQPAPKSASPKVQAQPAQIPQAKSDENLTAGSAVHKLQLLIMSEEKPSVSLGSAKIIKYGKCGFSAAYALDECGLLTISGEGAIWDFYWDFKTKTRDTPWWEQRKSISAVHIQRGITMIGRAAFNDCENLTSVSIPESVITIRYKAFNGCANLTSIHIPDSVTVIEESAFEHCPKLREVSVPAGATVNKYSFPESVIITLRA